MNEEDKIKQELENLLKIENTDKISLNEFRGYLLAKGIRIGRKELNIMFAGDKRVKGRPVSIRLYKTVTVTIFKDQHEKIKDIKKFNLSKHVQNMLEEELKKYE